MSLITNSITERLWNRPLGKSCLLCLQPFQESDTVFVHQCEAVHHVFHTRCVPRPLTSCPICLWHFTRINDQIIKGKEEEDYLFQKTVEKLRNFVVFPEILKKIKDIERQNIVSAMQEYADHPERRLELRHQIQQSVDNVSLTQLSKTPDSMRNWGVILAAQAGYFGIIAQLKKLGPIDSMTTLTARGAATSLLPAYYQAVLRVLGLLPPEPDLP